MAKDIYLGCDEDGRVLIPLPSSGWKPVPEFEEDANGKYRPTGKQRTTSDGQFVWGKRCLGFDGSGNETFVIVQTMTPTQEPPSLEIDSTFSIFGEEK